MTRDEFMALPGALALGVLYDENESSLRHIEAPQIPRPPKYDMRIFQRGGYVWASEFALRMLVWWRNKYSESASNGGQYAEKDAKRAASLDRWIAWRVCFPSDIWTGTRDDREVVAKMPSHKPTLHDRDVPPVAQPDYVAEDSDDIPF